MKTKNTAPIFFDQLTDFLHSLADRPQKHNQDSHPLFTPLLNSYLSHYQIDFHTQGLASTYSLWKSVMTSDQTHAADYTIVQQCWQVEIPKATVIIVHGYLDHSGLYGRLIRWSLEQNYNVICFDLPGHGLSSGEPANIDSFATYTHIFRQVIRNGIEHQLMTPERYAIGQSTGCSIIMKALLDKALVDSTLANGSSLNSDAIQPSYKNYGFEHVILLAPLVRSVRWNNLRWVYFALKPFIKTITRQFVSSSHDENFNYFIAHNDPLQAKHIHLNWLGAMEHWHQTIKTLPSNQASLQPLTVIQGTGDRTVDWRYNLPALCRCFPNNRLHFIPQAQHHLVKESTPYWKAVEQILDTQIITTKKDPLPTRNLHV
jgi:alpha-beta hydrolase superfamily lysophospholipase